MSKASKISSLEALRERQREIVAEQEATKQGLTTTLAQAPAKAKNYALEDLALPALGIGLAVYVGYRVLRPRRPVGYVEVGGVPGEDQARSVSPPPPHRYYDRPAKKSLFSVGTLMTVGKLLVPTAQAIVGAVQDHQARQQTK